MCGNVTIQILVLLKGSLVVAVLIVSGPRTLFFFLISMPQ